MSVFRRILTRFRYRKHIKKTEDRFASTMEIYSKNQERIQKLKELIKSTEI